MSANIIDPGKNVRQQFADTMLALGQEDEDLVVVVGDISHGIMQPFAQACPGRFYNIGILEPTMISAGAGMSKAGLTPVLHTIAPFIVERSYEQIKLDFCYHQLSGNIITVGGAFDYSNLGCTHHCYGDIGLLKTLPGVEILHPGSAIEFDQLVRQTYKNDALTYTRISGHLHSVDFGKDDIKFGRGIKVIEGSDVTIISTGPQLETAIGARNILAADGLSCEIIHIHTIRPLDNDLVLESVRKTKRVVVIEEHMRSGGLGDEVLKVVFNINNLQFDWAAIPDTFVTGYGEYTDHLERCGLTDIAVATRVKSMLGAR